MDPTGADPSLNAYGGTLAGVAHLRRGYNRKVVIRKEVPYCHMSTYMEVLAGHDPVAAADAEQRGLPAGAVEKVADRFGVSATRLCKTLGISVSRWQRAKASRRRLPRDASESLSRYVRLHEEASRLLRNPNAWFQSPSPYLKGITPFEMASTEAGGRAVEQILGRLSTSGPA